MKGKFKLVQYQLNSIAGLRFMLLPEYFTYEECVKTVKEEKKEDLYEFAVYVVHDFIDYRDEKK